MEDLKTIQSKIVSEIHKIAENYPDMLDGLLTDVVLDWCLEDTIVTLGTCSRHCLNLQSRFNLPEVNQSHRNIYRTLFESFKSRLKEYYDLFLIYHSIQKKRNIPLNGSLDIETIFADMKQILGEDLSNIEIGGR